MNLIPKVQRKYGSKSVHVTQQIADIGKNAAFRDWQHKLNRGDQLPRGKFFKNKSAGKPFMIMDEAHLLFDNSVITKPMPTLDKLVYDHNKV